MRVVSISNKMVRSVGSLSLPQPGQIFTVGSILWIINADGVGELIKPVQIDSAPITPTPATATLILEPPLRSSSSAICCPLPRYPRRQINNDDLITSIDQVGQKLTDCLSIVESALTTLVQRRPPSDFDLSEADQETLGVTAAIRLDVLRGKFADQVGDIYPLTNQIADQLSPTVNMLQIGRRPEASLQTILEENPDFES